MELIFMIMYQGKQALEAVDSGNLRLKRYENIAQW
jgi:hypothetical protein